MKKSLLITVLLTISHFILSPAIGQDPNCASDCLNSCSDQVPFSCSNNFYQLIERQLYIYSAEDGFSLTPVGPDCGDCYRSLNSVGYNTIDNFIYGLALLDGNEYQLSKIDANGNMCNLGEIPGLSNNFAGDFDSEGVLHIIAEKKLCKIDVNNVSLITCLTLTDDILTYYSDIVYNPEDGFFYAVGKSGVTMLRIDPIAGTMRLIQLVPSLGSCPAGFGSLWIDQNEDLFAYCNSNGKITKINVTSGATELMSATGESNSNNDGASCPFAQDIFNINCPKIENILLPNALCANEEIEIKTTNLSNMSISENMEADFGIRFVAFTAPTSNPYEGGRFLASVNFNELSNAHSEAITVIPADMLYKNKFYIYAILDNFPTQEDCSPSAVAIVEAEFCINCPGTTIADECGICLEEDSPDFNQKCADCEGVPNGTKIIDECGECLETNDSDFNQSCLDCEDVLNGTKIIDECGLCLEPNGSDFNQSCIDCEGVPNGTKITDECDVCLEPNDSNFNSCLDCEGVPNGTKITDECGICLEPNDSGFNQSCIDCAGIPNGIKITDECGICLEPNDSNFNQSCADCAGIPNGIKITDECGVCLEPDHTNFNQSCVDCAGIPNGNAVIDECGKCFATDHESFNDCFITIPTAFSPNDDGANDIFRPVYKNVSEFQLLVYNRWGENVFISTKNGWDGNFKGTPQKIGVYAFVLYYKYELEKPFKQITGNVTLIR